MLGFLTEDPRDWPWQMSKLAKSDTRARG